MRDLSKRVRDLGLIVVLVGSGGCLVPNPWLLVDEEIGSETRGHADGGTEETGTSGDEQTETSGMTVGDGDGDGVACGDGVVDDGEECDDANSDSGDGCLANCTVPRSCLDVHAFDGSLPDGEYMIAPSYPDPAFEVDCDMTKDGGGWTGLTLQHLCDGNLNWAVTPIDEAEEYEFDVSTCTLRTHGQGYHTYVLNIEFAPSFTEFYLHNHSVRANSPNGDQSEINGIFFIQSRWLAAYGNFHGDVSFGSPNEIGPITSYAAEGSQIECDDCEFDYEANGATHALSGSSSWLCVGWGEQTTNTLEGWYPWYAGTIFVR